MVSDLGNPLEKVIVPDADPLEANVITKVAVDPNTKSKLDAFMSNEASVSS